MWTIDVRVWYYRKKHKTASKVTKGTKWEKVCFLFNEKKKKKKHEHKHKHNIHNTHKWTHQAYRIHMLTGSYFCSYFPISFSCTLSILVCVSFCLYISVVHSYGAVDWRKFQHRLSPSIYIYIGIVLYGAVHMPVCSFTVCSVYGWKSESNKNMHWYSGKYFAFDTTNTLCQPTTKSISKNKVDSHVQTYIIIQAELRTPDRLTKW